MLFPVSISYLNTPLDPSVCLDPDFISLKSMLTMKHMFLVRISQYKKRERAGVFSYLLFPIASFLYTLLPFPRDTLELLGQILIKRNID